MAFEGLQFITFVIPEQSGIYGNVSISMDSRLGGNDDC